jgi:sugar lactone lactonase YvrE
MKIISVLEVNNTLGEGPLWHVDEQVLYWVDIVGKTINRFMPSTGEHKVYPQQEEISVIGFREKGGFIAAGRNGFKFWSEQDNQLTSIADPEADKPQARFNDGKVDRAGRFWAGTMTPKDATSALYRMDSDLSVHLMENGITISNGIGWSPDNHLMYYVDSLRYTIFVYDFELETGEIKNRRAFRYFSPGYGTPDGLTIDSRGFIWCAFWGGSKVVCFNPDGDMTLEIPLPVSQPTSCAFGGDDLSDLYITSAREGLSDAELKAQPLAGSLFVVETDVCGLAEPKFLG